MFRASSGMGAPEVNVRYKEVRTAFIAVTVIFALYVGIRKYIAWLHAKAETSPPAVE